MLTAEGAGRLGEGSGGAQEYVAAFNRSDFAAMLNYYKRNYPREPYIEDTSPVKKCRCRC